MKFIDTEEKEMLAMRCIFIASEIGGIAYCVDMKSRVEPLDFQSQRAIKEAMKSELADLFKQLDLMYDHLHLDARIVIPSDVRINVFLSLVNHYGKFSYALKHLIRETQNVDRNIKIEQEFYDMYMCAYELCMDNNLDIDEVFTLASDRYDERYKAWEKAGRVGKWV